MSYQEIIQGDCIEEMKKMEGGYADMCFCDPPFNISYEYDVYEDKKTKKEYLEWSSLWMLQVRRILTPTGTFWLAIGDEYAAELKVLATSLGFHMRNWVIWHYSFGVHCKKKFARCHTHFFYFVKDPKEFTFNADAIRVPSARQTKYRDRRANPAGRVPPDVWNFSRVCGTFKERAGFHGCQLPEKLVARTILACTFAGDIVVDPFSGSGTTAVVCKKLRRAALGIELSPDYVEKSRSRLIAANLNDPLEGHDG